MPPSTAQPGRPEPWIIETRPLVAPENDRICEKVVAPRMMNRMTPEMAVVPISALTSAAQVRLR